MTNNNDPFSTNREHENMLSKDSIAFATPDQVSADLGEGAVVLDLRAGMYYELNTVGARVWTLIQKPQSLQSILDTLLAEYDVEAERCEADLRVLLEDMVERGLAVIEGEADKDIPKPER